MEIIYSSKPVSGAGDRKVIDPKEFDTPINGATAIYYDGDNMKITYGYETRGVPVKPISAMPGWASKTSKKRN